MTVREIIEKHLKENGYDGLWTEELDGCGCHVGDLVPCGVDPTDCKPGVEVSCRCAKDDDCTCDCIGPRKETP